MLRAGLVLALASLALAGCASRRSAGGGEMLDEQLSGQHSDRRRCPDGQVSDGERCVSEDGNDD